MSLVIRRVMLAAFATLLSSSLLVAVDKNFHDAPDSAKAQKNPVEGQPTTMAEGKRLYGRNCLSCHGIAGHGKGNVPSLVDEKVKAATDGEVFWFITKGSKDNGMPAWAFLPELQRWQIVTYVKSLASAGAADTASAKPTAAPEASAAFPAIKAPAPTVPFTDFRFEKPGNTRKITLKDLPEPFVTKSANNGADEVPRPADAWPVAPPGFKVEQYASGLNNPRWLRIAPNGDLFVAESDPGRIRVFRGMTNDGKSEESSVFATGMRHPYGIAFYPPGPDPQWVYVGSENELTRFAYHRGDMKATGAAEHIADLPTGGHWTRAVEFSLDGKHLFVGVGSESNVDDPEDNPSEKNRATIMSCDPAHCELQVYASGIRNAGGGLAVNPKTGELWCSVNERDALGDNLVPDYITHVQEGGFYGWPWWYLGSHQDPRHKGKHPELKDKAIVPDVLIQPHNASLQPTFYQGQQFPAEYQGDIFAAEHGSWNKTVRVGYEVIRVPLHQTGHASGEYQDFLTGFVLPNGKVWGRPVGVAVAPDGSLLVSDDTSNVIWRVVYTGK